MPDRETILPLIVGVIFAISAHLCAAAGYIALRDGAPPRHPLTPPPNLPQSQEPKIGDDTASPVTANWISYEDYRDLLARKADFDQAATQRDVQPTPNAPVPLNPTPPATTAHPEAPQPPVPPAPPTPRQTVQTPTPPTPPAETMSPDALALALPKLQPDTDPLLSMPLKPQPVREPSQPQPTPAPPRLAAAAPAALPPNPPTPPTKPTEPAKPTSAPKDQSESLPASRTESLTVQPGDVIARQGIKINTVHPRFSPVALRTSAPTNPDVLVVFDPSGRVVQARIVQSSGYANVDGPILASLYKWTATGESLQNIEDELTLQIHIILTPE